MKENKKKFFTVKDADKLSINQIHDLYKKFINPNQTKIFSSLPFGKDVFKSAEGVFLYTKKNKKILDFTGGLGVLGLGHNHPKILKARIEFQKKKKIEVHKIIFSQYMAALSSNIAQLLTPNLTKSFFLNSGAEAVDAAIKVCHKSFEVKKKYILYSDKSYHGKLIGSGSISGSYKKDNNFPVMKNCADFKFNDLKDLETKIKKYNKIGGVYCVIVEPFSASLLEGCSEEFIKKLFELKKIYGFRIVFDEVFTGFFKSKKMFYFQNFFKVEPDAICLSKTLGGGKSSISCLVVNNDVYEKAYGKISDTFLHTTTYNGFGEESVTALEALNIMANPEFEKKVQSLEKLLKQKLFELKKNHVDKIEQIKGNGILNGIIFKSPTSLLEKLLQKIPIRIINDKSFFLKKIMATAVSCELYEKYNILTSINDSSLSNHLCVSPSLIIDKKNIDYFFESLDKILRKKINYYPIRIILNYLKT